MLLTQDCNICTYQGTLGHGILPGKGEGPIRSQRERQKPLTLGAKQEEKGKIGT